MPLSTRLRTHAIPWGVGGCRGAGARGCIDPNACFPRRTFWMMASGSAVQVKGFGLSFVSARYRLMTACRSTMLLKTPRLSRCRVNFDF
jgi:hypothetical protein